MTRAEGVAPGGIRWAAYLWEGREYLAAHRGGIVQRNGTGWFTLAGTEGFDHVALKPAELELIRQCAPNHDIFPPHLELAGYGPQEDDDERPPLEAYEDMVEPVAPVGGALRAAEMRAALLGPDDIDRLPDPTWLVDRYIPAGALTAIYGRPGSYKTFVAFDWACSVASGTWWIGHQVAQGPVLYVMAEGVGGLRRRKQAWEEGHRVYLKTMPLNVYPKAINLLDPEWSEGIAEVAQQLGAALTVIDTVARCFPGGEENNSRDMGTLIAAADLVRERSGGAVCLVHHTPIEGNRLRGHSSLEGALDAAIGVEYDGTTIKLTLAKQKDDESGFEMLLHPEAIKDSVVIRPGSAPTDNNLPASVLATLQALADIETEGGASASQWRDSTCSTRTTFYRHLKHLNGTGLCHTVTGDVGQPNARYALTEQGKDLIYS